MLVLDNVSVPEPDFTTLPEPVTLPEMVTFPDPAIVRCLNDIVVSVFESVNVSASD